VLSVRPLYASLAAYSDHDKQRSHTLCLSLSHSLSLTQSQWSRPGGDRYRTLFHPLAYTHTPHTLSYTHTHTTHSYSLTHTAEKAAERLGADRIGLYQILPLAHAPHTRTLKHTQPITQQSFLGLIV